MHNFIKDEPLIWLSTGTGIIPQCWVNFINSIVPPDGSLTPNDVFQRHLHDSNITYYGNINMLNEFGQLMLNEFGQLMLNEFGQLMLNEFGQLRRGVVFASQYDLIEFVLKWS